MARYTKEQKFSVAKSRLTAAQEGLLDAASLLRELKLTTAAERYERLAEQIQQFTPQPSHNDECDGCGSPADHARLRNGGRSVAGHMAAMALAETIDKGGTVEVPSLGITLTKKDRTPATGDVIGPSVTWICRNDRHEECIRSGGTALLDDHQTWVPCSCDCHR